MSELIDLLNLKEFCEIKRIKKIESFRQKVVKLKVKHKFTKNKFKYYDYNDLLYVYNLVIKRRVRSKYHAKKILIIEYFLSHNLNTAKEISLELGVTESQVNRTIKEWIDNDKCVIMESKINTI